jgi:hypothetical protein
MKDAWITSSGRSASNRARTVQVDLVRMGEYGEYAPYAGQWRGRRGDAHEHRWCAPGRRRYGGALSQVVCVVRGAVGNVRTDEIQFGRVSG